MKLIFTTILLLIFSGDYSEKYYIFYKEYNTPNIKGLVKKWSIIYKLDESLVLSVIDLESEFNPNCKNNKSTAYGLFQFLQHSTEWIGDMAGYKNLQHYNLPVHIQVELGCLYLRYLLDKYDGNERLALKEYSGNTPNYWKQIKKRRVKYL